MEISKMGLKILKHLRDKDKKYNLLNVKMNDNAEAAMSTYNEIKKLFPTSAYSKVTFELISLIDDRKIYLNNPKDPYTLTDETLDKFSFGLSGKGHAFLENRLYRWVSKYIPLTISLLSFVVSLVSLFYTISTK